ncbi:hypothetical protein AOT99_gpU4 [Vespertilionid gammaherpesvirus 1]|uniref:BHLH domain-containing protein n=1 Tax=Vespertilionid gammaherpesvirus 1 TaxID=2560830 RepID=A0A0X9YMH1_9GAMA|nr:hypothetical protein AOT99_gpU4 [Myotis gammaherpesvirus 8]AMA67358.1 hypothetical protein AOT99_gpU4 [Vespertilionid gammaherpesvirus 1]
MWNCLWGNNFTDGVVSCEHTCELEFDFGVAGDCQPNDTNSFKSQWLNNYCDRLDASSDLKTTTETSARSLASSGSTSLTFQDTCVFWPWSDKSSSSGSWCSSENSDTGEDGDNSGGKLKDNGVSRETSRDSNLESRKCLIWGRCMPGNNSSEKTFSKCTEVIPDLLKEREKYLQSRSSYEKKRKKTITDKLLQLQGLLPNLKYQPGGREGVWPRITVLQQAAVYIKDLKKEQRLLESHCKCLRRVRERLKKKVQRLESKCFV